MLATVVATFARRWRIPACELLPMLTAGDDLGNEHDGRGGAFGPDPDGGLTRGSLTARTAYDMTLGVRD